MKNKIALLSAFCVALLQSVLLTSQTAQAALPPLDEHGALVLAEDSTVDDAAGAALLKSAKSIVIPGGVKLTYTVPAELILSANVSGSGVFEAAGSGAVTLSGDNAGLIAPGSFVFSGGTPVVVTSETGLGGPDSGPATFLGNVPADRLRFVSSSNVFTNYAPVVMKLVSASDSGTFYFGSEAADKYLVQAASFTASVDNYKTTKFYFKHNVEVIGGIFTVEKYPYLYSSGAGKVRFGEEVDVVWGHSAQAIVYFNNLQLGCRSLKAKAGLAANSTPNILLLKAHCLSSETVLRPYVTWHVQTSSQYNLNGFDQTISHLNAIENWTAANQCAFINSSSPATLYARGDKAGVSTERWKMRGSLSYWHETNYTNIFSVFKMESDGDLTVARGKVAFTNGSGWSGDNVTVKAGGTLECESLESLTSSEHRLAVEPGGHLIVAAGVTLRLKSAVFGETSLPLGRRLTLDQVRELVASEDVIVEGDGAVEMAAESIAGEWKGWPEAGTSQTAVIPDGAVVSLTDDDIEKVSALSQIRAGVGTRIVCKTTQTPFELKPSLSGDLVFEAESCGTVILSGDNTNILSPGGFVFSNTTVIVSNRYGLGSALTGAAHFWPAAPLTENKSVLQFGGEALTNDVKLVFHHGAQVGHQDPAVRFVQNGDVFQYEGSSASTVRRFGIVNDFTLASGAKMDVFCTHQAVDSHFRIEQGASLKANGNFGNGYYHIAGSISGDLAIEQGMRRFIFERENTLSVNSCRFYDGSEKKFFFDLNGFNQTMPRVLGNQYGTTPYQQYFDVTSATPATLILNAAAKMNSGAAIRCLDQASLTYSGASTQTIGFATSTTQGSLTINSGAIAFERNAKWLGPTIVVNGGALIVRESAATNTFGVGRATQTDLTVNGDGRLELLSSEFESTVRSITRNGKLLDRGVYNASNCDWITGSGSLRAVTGNPIGFHLFVK